MIVDDLMVMAYRFQAIIHNITNHKPTLTFTEISVVAYKAGRGTPNPFNFDQRNSGEGIKVHKKGLQIRNLQQKMLQKQSRKVTNQREPKWPFFT